MIPFGLMLQQSGYNPHFSHNTDKVNATKGHRTQRETQWEPAFLHKPFLHSDMTRGSQQFFTCMILGHKAVKN